MDINELKEKDRVKIEVVKPITNWEIFGELVRPAGEIVYQPGHGGELYWSGHGEVVSILFDATIDDEHPNEWWFDTLDEILPFIQIVE